MLNYYLNLPKEYDIDLDANINISRGIMRTAKKSFDSFEKYLQNVINAMKEKEVEAEWEEVKVKNIAKLEMIGWLYKIPKEQSAIEVMDSLGLKKGDALISSAKGIINVAKIDGNCVYTDLKVGESEHLFFNNEPVKFTLKRFNRPDGIVINESGDEYTLYSEKKLPNYKSIGQTASFVNFDNLRFENGEKLKAERSEDLNLILENENDYGKSVSDGRIKFRLENIKRNNKEAWFIQLKEVENKSQNDEINALSPLRYFFDDDIFVVDDKNEYSIDIGIETENKIVLKNKKGEFSHPESKIIRVKVNTYSLQKQLEAVRTLKDMPIGEHGKLIKLFEKREIAKWDKPLCVGLEEWFVITDPQRSGATEQRRFVEQALSTPDFAILEGPPGSGKTTVILELICQLANLGKRVLLCGSTHVAIDNILERLKEKHGNSSLLKEFQILPVRIGDQNRINDDVKEFQIDNLKQDNNIDENAVELLLDSANLVCGTTIGILQHPKFKKRNTLHRWLTKKDGQKMKKSWLEPIVPEFDYLIIDESSKTTFQEFLVPALYAKKWILAGDCLQLSPFTERDEIVSNIEELQICTNEKLEREKKYLPISKNLQSAVFYLHKLDELLKGQDNKDKNNKFILLVSEEEINEIKNELKKGRPCGQLLYYITKENVNKINTLIMTVCDIVFVDKHILEQALPKLPETHAVLRYTGWYETRHAFAHNAFPGHDRFYYKERGRDYTDSFEIVKHINEYFREKNWAEEIAWRIEREHQLRLVEKNNSKRYTEVISELIPRSLNGEAVENEINMVASMAFPSILESLVKGIKGRKVKFESTISDGFKEDDLSLRRTTLIYQHRMHPEISKFPRDNFYKQDDALKDCETPKHVIESRMWGYGKYTRRNIWVDVKGNVERGNRNNEEANRLMEHLREFVNWAKENKHSEGEGKEWSVACLTFYRGQEKIIREKLRSFTGKSNAFSNFDIKEDGKCKINIKLHTVDKFQGHEADIVFLSMVQNKRVGFMDNPNRLNVAVTRAKFQLVIFGDKEYFAKGRHNSDELRELANSMEV